MSASDLLLPAVRELEGDRRDRAREIHGALAGTCHDGDTCKGDLLRIGARDSFTTVLAECVRHLMANDGSELSHPKDRVFRRSRYRP